MKKRIFTLSFLILLTACGEEKSVSLGSGEEKVKEIIQYKVPMPGTGENRYRDQDEGKEQWFAIGPLSGVGEVNANGVAQANMFESGVYRFTLNLNIERAEEGFFYEAWLTNEEGDQVSIGHLRSHFGDVRHALAFQAEADFGKDLRTYSSVRITLEADDGNTESGTAVAEGELKTRER